MAIVNGGTPFIFETNNNDPRKKININTMRTKRGGLFNLSKMFSRAPTNPVKVNSNIAIPEDDIAISENYASYSIIVSHNSRIQCLLGKIGIGPKKTDNLDKIRFKNCCILKILCTEEYIRVELIYSGNISQKDLNDPSKIFYSNSSRDTDPTKYVRFEPVTFKMDKRKMGLQNVSLSHPYVFFLVRHGQSEHNETNTMGLEIDTSLTPTGFATADRARDALENYLIKNYFKDSKPEMPELFAIDKITGFFVSDLYRTRQTMNSFNKFNFGENVYVLPCASEVGNVGKNGDCDSSGQIWNKLARENYSSCNPALIKYSRDKTTDDPKCRANWDIYLGFYGNQMRGQTNLLGTRMRCRDTNMLAMAIYILDFKEKMSLDEFIRTGSIVPSGSPLPEKMTNTRTGLFNWSFGGTKRRKLKRKRTRRRG
jgi:broad specificity phosphatase PhoE